MYMPAALLATLALWMFERAMRRRNLCGLHGGACPGGDESRVAMAPCHATTRRHCVRAVGGCRNSSGLTVDPNVERSTGQPASFWFW